MRDNRKEQSNTRKMYSRHNRNTYQASTSIEAILARGTFKVVKAKAS